jgi:hypothetical protein
MSQFDLHKSVKQLTQIGVRSENSSRLNRKIAMANLRAAMAILWCTIFVTSMIYTGSASVAIPLIVAALCYGSSFIFAAKKQYVIQRLLIALPAQPVLTFYMLWMGPHSHGELYYLVFLALAFVVFDEGSPVLVNRRRRLWQA